MIQRGTPVEVWGTCNPTATGQATVSLSLNQAELAHQPLGTDGSWRFTLPPQSASSFATLSVKCETATAMLTVQFGEVLLCGGQSNMGLTVGKGPFASGMGLPAYGFHADNGTAESAAAGRYTGKIRLKAMSGRPTQRPGVTPTNATHWFDTTPESLPYFSAVCWYTGRYMFEHMKGKVPVGLILGANGGTAIEVFMPPQAVTKCMVPADCHQNVTAFGQLFDKIVTPLGKYRVSAMVWDQAEADVSCGHTPEYACLERGLVDSWRASLGSKFPVVAVQLPGYTGDCKDLCGDVFAMRRAQRGGLMGSDEYGSVAVTYDTSCPDCPYGAVHNTHKVTVGERVARQILKLRRLGLVVADGPQAVLAVVTAPGPVGTYTVTINFTGEAAPFHFAPTRNCTDCCAVSDFDGTADGISWHNASAATVVGSTGVRFTLAGMAAPPTKIRYTAARYYPQCALYNTESIPAFPFVLQVKKVGRPTRGPLV